MWPKPVTYTYFDFVPTAESDVGDDGDVAKSSFVHYKKTVEIEEYKGLLSDDEGEGGEVDEAIQGVASKPAVQSSKTTGSETPDINDANIDKEKPKTLPKKSVSFDDESPEAMKSAVTSDAPAPSTGVVTEPEENEKRKLSKGRVKVPQDAPEGKTCIT